MSISSEDEIQHVTIPPIPPLQEESTITESAPKRKGKKKATSGKASC